MYGECSSILSNYGIELPNETKKELNAMIDGLGHSTYEKCYMKGYEEGYKEGYIQGYIEGYVTTIGEVIGKLLEEGYDVRMIFNLTRVF